jgi:hypothetical protein
MTERELKIWDSDFFDTVYYNLSDYIRSKSYKSSGSPTIRGWHVHPMFRKQDVETILSLDDIVIDRNLSFKENYKNNKKIFFKWIKENINFD